jgi:hypothetical protein
VCMCFGWPFTFSRFYSQSPTLDLWLEITKSRKFVIRGFIWISKSWSQVPTILQAKMAHQSKQMRVGARKGFAYHSVKLVLPANGNRYEVLSNTFFLVVKPSIHSKSCHVLTWV